MSHELRTPLNAILGFSQVLEMRDLGPRGNAGVQHMLTAGRHLLQLIDEVLDISGIEAGRMTLSLEPIDVAQSVREVLDLARPLAAPRHIQFVDEVTSSGSWHILADHQRLTQVLLEPGLQRHQVQPRRWTGHPRPARRSPADGCACWCGTPAPACVPPRWRGSSSPSSAWERRARASTGTGIGLALSKRLMEAMGGTIGVESVVGEGSTFWIELPLTESAAALQSPCRPWAPQARSPWCCQGHAQCSTSRTTYPTSR